MAPSARLTIKEKAYLPKIEFELAKCGSRATYWELQALARVAVMRFDGYRFEFGVLDNWVQFEKFAVD